MKIQICFFLAIFVTGCLTSCQSGAGDALPLLASHDFEDGSATGWRPHGTWSVANQDGSHIYELVSPGERGEVSGPRSRSLMADHDVSAFVFTGRLKSNADPSNENRDICLLFHYQDPSHFYYVHLSATSDGLHNIIGLVNGTDRTKINLEPAGETIPRLKDMEWHDFKVTCDADTGFIQAYLDDMKTPLLSTRDRTLTHGLVGIASYDDTGFFDDIELRGNP
jgi:hypothetical protein